MGTKVKEEAKVLLGGQEGWCQSRCSEYNPVGKNRHKK